MFCFPEVRFTKILLEIIVAEFIRMDVGKMVEHILKNTFEFSFPLGKMEDAHF